MATVNLANKTWLIESQTPTINIYTSNTYVDFNMGYDLTDELACAKACIEINASAYKTITLQYSSILAEGITSLYFGVFDNMIAEYYYNTEYDNGISSSSLAGINVTEMPRQSGGTITIDIPSNVTGTKYVGFLFYGNTFWFDDDVGYSARQKIDITSINAVESGYTLTYNANGGYGEPGLVSNVTSTIISSTVPTRSGYDFLGWSTSSTETSVSYVAGNSILLSSNVTLYAVWKAKNYTLSLNGNGGSFPGGSSYTVTYNSGNYCSFAGWNIPTRAGYTFNGLYTAASGGTKIYNRDGSCVNDGAYWKNSVWVHEGNCTLYAQWIANTYTVVYNANGASGVMDNTTHVYDTAKTLAANAFTKAGYAFIGWNTKADGSGDFYSNNQSVKNLTSTNGGTITLYAQWEVQGLVYIYDSGKFSPYQVLIYDGFGWNQYVPYIYTESGWVLYSG